ncbi:MAG: zinc finger domain-containing protein, partial [Pseudomonadota bacterium]
SPLLVVELELTVRELVPLGPQGLQLAVHGSAHCDESLLADLARLGDELRFVLITSEARLASLSDAPAEASATEIDALKILAAASEAPKCERCWHRRFDVGANLAHPTLCSRCVSNVEGPGEIRYFA